MARAEIPNIYRRNSVFQAIAEKQVEVSEHKEALQVAEAMADDQEKVSALAAIAKSQFRAGLQSEAEASVSSAVLELSDLRLHHNRSD